MSVSSASCSCGRASTTCCALSRGCFHSSGSLAPCSSSSCMQGHLLAPAFARAAPLERPGSSIVLPMVFSCFACLCWFYTCHTCGQTSSTSEIPGCLQQVVVIVWTACIGQGLLQGLPERRASCISCRRHMMIETCISLSTSSRGRFVIQGST